MPLILPEADRRRIANRLMVQAPSNAHDLAEFQRFMSEHKRIEGFDSDVLVVLESVAILADQGNRVAQALYMDECKRLGITFGTRYEL